MIYSPVARYREALKLIANTGAGKAKRIAQEALAEKPKRWKPGPKGKASRAATVALKRECERLGIKSCEARFAGCWGDNAMGFAHRYKRRNITTRLELRTAALVCKPCHDKLEILPEAEMAARDPEPESRMTLRLT